MPSKTTTSHWYYPREISNDLKDIDLPAQIKEEILACAWEYARSVIPQYSNWNRYVAFMRTIVVGIVAEFRGGMIDVTAEPPKALGYNLDGILDDLFHGTPAHKAMAVEFKSFLLITSQKASQKRHTSELFRRYCNALSVEPRQWFRMRDCDALARFTIAAALACNDLLDVWYTEEQLDIICEIGDTMYDAVAFYKHRSEGETNSTFAYMPEEQRILAFERAREILWALDLALVGTPGHTVVTNFLRTFGGPIHMMMRRYRFVEDQLKIGKHEDEIVIAQVRQNFKLWNRVDAAQEKVTIDYDDYENAIANGQDYMFDGLAEALQTADTNRCQDCSFRESYGVQKAHVFGGVQLCKSCRMQWGKFLDTLPARAQEVFPDLKLEL